MRGEGFIDGKKTDGEYRPEYSIDKLNIEVIENSPDRELAEFGWPMELFGRGESHPENGSFLVKFPMGDVFLSYVTLIHELGHLRQTDRDATLSRSDAAYDAEVDAWQHGLSRFAEANPELFRHLNTQVATHTAESEAPYHTFQDLYNWVGSTVLGFVSEQAKYFGASAPTTDSKQRYFAQLRKMGWEIFLKNYDLARTGHQISIPEASEAIKKTVAHIITEQYPHRQRDHLSRQPIAHLH